MEDIQEADLPTLDLPRLGIAPEHYAAIETAVKELSRQGLEIRIIASPERGECNY